ncbi:MAG TPA: serine/threonine-protein kinase, partial [Kofleriaceae bacterium]|nr:serine/threonine-protein kinase [Kofleriaceae bacterium]
MVVSTTATLAEPGKLPRRPPSEAPPPGPEELAAMAEGLGLVDRFEVVGQLGRGGMGVVLEARDRRLGRDVAIKVLSGARMYDGVARARFEREARAAARLSDPSIVTVHELASTGDYMVMELVRGESLKDRLERGPLPPAEVRRVGAALCRALSVAHAAGVIHRDVKPSNVLIDAAEGIRLADFGIATFTDAELTVTGVTVGTPAYMAPEQLRGGAVNARSDLYAVGATLFEAA